MEYVQYNSIYNSQSRQVDTAECQTYTCTQFRHIYISTIQVTRESHIYNGISLNISNWNLNSPLFFWPVLSLRFLLFSFWWLFAWISPCPGFCARWPVLVCLSRASCVPFWPCSAGMCFPKWFLPAGSPEMRGCSHKDSNTRVLPLDHPTFFTGNVPRF